LVVLVISLHSILIILLYACSALPRRYGHERRSLEKATELMLDVHNKGRAVVSSGTREHSEFDVYRLHEHGLWATMQREDA
jgi:ATP-dependent Clp protease adaptor protein ClpS